MAWLFCADILTAGPPGMSDERRRRRVDIDVVRWRTVMLTHRHVTSAQDGLMMRHFLSFGVRPRVLHLCSYGHGVFRQGLLSFHARQTLGGQALGERVVFKVLSLELDVLTAGNGSGYEVSTLY